MHNFLKRLLNKKEPRTCIIAFDAVPGWLDNREDTAYASLKSKTAVPVHNIRNATAQLQHILNGIAGAEHDPEIHPKLKSIAKNSLPLFVKAMNASLTKEFPEDVEAFYTVAVECVKGCLNSTRGQGRYLQAAFPEKMKEIRTGIDVIGREINGINTALALYRNEKLLIDKSRAIHTALKDIRADAEKSKAKDQRMSARIADMTSRLVCIEEEIIDLQSDTRMAEVEKLRSSLREMEKTRDDTTRNYAALSMTSSHVFRKAEKIAAKKRHASEISTLRNTMELLSDHAIPEIEDLSKSLAAAFPVTERMIAAGEVTLKNKEERAIFADTMRYSSAMCSACREINSQEDTCRITRDTLAAHPLVIGLQSLEREKLQLKSMLKKEDLSRKDLAEWTEKIRERIPALEYELGKKIAEIVGESVQIQVDNHMPA
jgi:hypothetical protein